MVTRTILKLMAPLWRRVMLMVGRALVHAVNDGLKMQELQISLLKGETLEGVEHWLPYGFTHHPHPGAEALAVFLGGNRNHGIVVAVADRRYRLYPLAEGEMAIHDDLGQKVHLKRNGIVVEGLNILLKSAGVIRLEGDGVEIHGREYVQTDVHGLGERRTWSGGTDWQDDTFTTGAVITSSEHGLDQPDIPSDHPEGP